MRTCGIWGSHSVVEMPILILIFRRVSCFGLQSISRRVPDDEAKNCTMKRLHVLYLWRLEFLSVIFFCSCWVEMLVFICQLPFRHSGLSVFFSWAYQMYYISLAAWNIEKLSHHMFPTYIKMLSDLDIVRSKYFTLVPYSISRGRKSDNCHL
jgi:hypothetical protein